MIGRRVQWVVAGLAGAAMYELIRHTGAGIATRLLWRAPTHPGQHHTGQGTHPYGQAHHH